MVKNMRLETERLIIRPYVESDRKEAFDLMQDKDLFTYLADMDVMSFDEYMKLFNWIIQCYDTGFDKDFKYSFVICLKDSGRQAGWCRVGGLEYNHYDKEIYYLIGKAFQGNGYATEAVKALVEYCFNVISLYALAAKVDPENIASIKVLDKTGFVYHHIICGLFDQYEHCNGELYYTLRKDEYLAC